jgi:hypothetical protein
MGRDRGTMGKKEIHKELDKAERMPANGGHLVPPDVTWANFRYAVEHLRQMVLD